MVVVSNDNILTYRTNCTKSDEEYVLYWTSTSSRRYKRHWQALSKLELKSARVAFYS